MRSDPFPSSHLLFAYGTLMLTTGIAEVDAAMRNAGVSLGKASVPGRLFDLGDYPGAVPLQDGPAPIDAASEDAPKVLGHLLRLSDPGSLFGILDPYEGFDPSRPGESEFVRARAPITLAVSGDVFEAQIYWYNFPVAGRPAIADGDYLAHWAAKGRPGQGRRG